MVTAINTTSPDLPDAFHESVYVTTATPWDACRPRWVNDRTFHYAFIPKNVTYDGSILSALQYAYETLPIEEKRVGEKTTLYRLSRELAQQWYWIEQVIGTLEAQLMRHCSATLPLGYERRYDFHPSQYNYRDWYTERHHACRSANLARGAFVVRLAMVSYLVLKGQSESRDVFQILHSHGGLSPEFLNNIAGSWVANRKVPRVGAILNAHTPPLGDHQWASEIKTLMSYRCIPFWIDYGPIPLRPSVLNLPDKFFPGKDVVMRYIQAFEHRAREDARAQVAHDVHEAVAFVRGWLEERAQSAVKAIQLETPSQKAERELREKQYGNLEMPGRRGPRVYRWEYHLGMWNRLRVPYEQFEAIWMATTPRMRVYNSVQHEYDICYHLDEEATAALHAEMTQVYDSNDDSHRVPYDPRETARTTTDRHSSRRSRSASPRRSNMPRLPGRPGTSGEETSALPPTIPGAHTVDDNLDATSMNVDSFETAITLRYGLRIPSDPPPRLFSPNEQKQARHILRWAVEPPPAATDNLNQWVSYFVDLCLNAQPIPSSMYDSSPRALQPALTNAYKLYAVEIAPKDWKIADTLRCGVAPVPGAERDKTYFVESRREIVQGWKLVVHSELDAAHIIRASPVYCKNSSRYEAAAFCVARGITFRTLAPRRANSEVPRPLPQSSMGLGRRHNRFGFSPKDYRLYERTRDALLAGPQGRAALLAGGLTWRLAIDALGLEYALQGPSHTKMSQVVATVNGIEYVDDVLTQEELDIIAGVYFVYSREC